MKRTRRGAPILTLTGNLLWEQTLEYKAWAPGETQRALRESFQVGGKGINVSKMLNRLGAPNTALCFAGGRTGGAAVAWLADRKFRFRAFASSSPTRSGVVVRGGPSRETTFLGPDAAPGADAVRACAAYLNARPGGQILALCGSFPGWEGRAFGPLRHALERWMRRGVLVVDSYGAPLAWAAERRVDLVKVNRGEFEGLKPGLRRHSPVRAWVVTDGARPVTMVDGAERAILKPPRIREVSPTGSGDVLLACILHARYQKGLPLSAAVAFALPYAAANAAHPGIAEFPCFLPDESA